MNELTFEQRLDVLKKMKDKTRKNLIAFKTELDAVQTKITASADVLERIMLEMEELKRVQNYNRIMKEGNHASDD